jgi:tetratricopeptide (TPR) repeat protein
VRFRAGCIVIFMLMPAFNSPASGQTQQQIDWCTNKDMAYSAEQSINGCNEVIRSGKDIAWAFLYRGDAFYRQGNGAQANADYTQAIKLDPNGDVGYAAYVQRGWKGTSFDESLADYNAAIRLNPKRPEAIWRRAQLYTSKEDIEHALADYKEVIRLDPKNFIYYRDRAQIYESRNDFASAAADNETIARLPDYAYVSVIYWTSACRDRLTAGQIEQALKDCEAGLAALPTDPPAHDARGLIYLKTGDFDQAIADFDAALSVFPNVAFSFYGRGLAKLKKDDVTGGNDDLAKANMIQPDIANEFARYGVKAEPQTVAAPPSCNSAPAGSATQNLAMIPKCAVVYCAPDADLQSRNNLKHIDDMLAALQLRITDATASLQKFQRACRAIEGNTGPGPTMNHFRAASFELGVNMGKLSQLYDSLQQPPEEETFAATSASMTRVFKQPGCMSQINQAKIDGLNAAEVALKDAEMDCSALNH